MTMMRLAVDSKFKQNIFFYLVMALMPTLVLIRKTETMRKMRYIYMIFAT